MTGNHQAKVDEDEGSPFRNGVNSLGGFGTPLSRLLNQQEKKIERSAEAFRVRHTRHIFPSKDNFAYNTARVIARSKGRGWHKHNHVIAKAMHFRLKQSLSHQQEIASSLTTVCSSQ